jgi:NAD(P)-dependent dehydrogenase (short-subunit alcohol dehydrogenase family)
MNLRDFWKGKTILITGGCGGIGKVIASKFLDEGATVFVCDINTLNLNALVLKLKSDSVKAIELDVTSAEDCAHAINVVTDLSGRLDLLINAAGVWTEGASRNATELEWDRVIDVNLKGTFFMCRFAIPHLEQSQGSIINISSDAGISGSAGAAIYCASKAGVNLLTKSLALELAPFGVRVNAICPCDVDTPMIEYQANIFGNGNPENYKQALLSAYPQADRARFAKPEEIASFIYYVASPEAAPITGACLSIDFGTTAGS